MDGTKLLTFNTLFHKGTSIFFYAWPEVPYSEYLENIHRAPECTLHISLWSLVNTYATWSSSKYFRSGEENPQQKNSPLHMM